MTDGQRITSDAQQHLFLNPERLNTAAPSGLWFCADVIPSCGLYLRPPAERFRTELAGVSKHALPVLRGCEKNLTE